MRTYGIIAWLALLSGFVQAQQPFEKFYNSGVSYQMKLIELSSGNLLAALALYPGISLMDANELPHF